MIDACVNVLDGTMRGSRASPRIESLTPEERLSGCVRLQRGRIIMVVCFAVVGVVMRILIQTKKARQMARLFIGFEFDF